ncbi:hypothetical protein [Halovenus marina]|uniref:hypothetical protein n=1 Tax=Halovenus marina TaxID=3396621 RepID=UPI003F57F8EF
MRRRPEQNERSVSGKQTHQGTATLAVDAPPPGEQRTITLSEHRYLLLLPESLIGDLHDVHPFVALGVLNGIIAGIILTLAAGLGGLNRRRRSSRRRALSLWIRLRRLFG